MFLHRRHLRIEQASDPELLLAAQQGSSDAIAILYRRHSPLIYRFTLRLSRNTAIAEEITQEVFLALLRHPNRYDPQRGNLTTWLCGIARRQLWRHLERSQRFVPIDSPDSDAEPFDPPSPDDDPAQHLTRAEAVAAVRQGLDELPLLLREVIVLCELEELTYQQVSLILAIPIGTVRSRLHRARARLATLLRPSTENQPS
jgi:RNA polymerase sigma-70 factor, ECF subfamily